MIAILFAAALLQDPAERLRKAVDEARRELASEKDRIRKEDASQEAELETARARVAALADEFVDCTRALARKTKGLEVRRAERATLRESRSASRQTWTDVRRTASDAHAKLADFLESLPPGERREDQRKALARLKTSLDAAGAEAFDVRPLLDVAGSLLEETLTVVPFSHPVRNADGAQEPAELLRAGMIFTAYKTTASGRLGEVFAAPASAGGYRWSETLPAWAAEDVRRVFAGAAEIPVDVTQRLSPSQRNEGRSFLEILKAGGLVMIPLGALALLAGFVVLERTITLSSRGASTELAVRGILDRARAGDASGAARLSALGRGTAMKTLAAALTERAGGRARMEEAVLEAMLHETPVLERFLPLLGVLAGVSPMLGLLGTVTGMITTFDMIRLFGSGDPGLMAGGISEALVATATGLVIAIPILLFHSWFSGRVDRIMADAQRHSTTLVNILCGAEEKEEAGRAG